MPKTYSKQKIFLDSNIKIYHAGGTSHDEEINFEMEKSRNWHWMWSTFYFHKKHYGFNRINKNFTKIFILDAENNFLLLSQIKKKKDIYYCRFEGI